jgi:hypothetical protein
MSKLTSLLVVFLVTFSFCYKMINDIEKFVDYDLDEANEIWNEYESHTYVKRTTPTTKSIDIANDIVNNDEIFIMRYWETFHFDGDLDWSEDPFDDWTWQFYFHSLRMVSHLLNAYEISGNMTYLEESKWFIESWMSHNPNPDDQASPRAWDDHSTANRISTFIYFWDNYRNSEIFDDEFAVELLNMMRKHGEYTADSSNYYWGHNHGIYQDRSLLQLGTLFPIFEDSREWVDISNSRLELHLDDGVTESGVHKEHSPAYHLLVMKLFMDIDDFNGHYHNKNEKLSSLVYKMQEFLIHIAKPDGTVPSVGDSFNDNVMRHPKESVTNEHLLFEITNGLEGVEIENKSIVYSDAGIAVFKNDWDNEKPIYFSLFNAYHSFVHKQSDDLSFVLTYGDTDFFVDGGKYNFVESDPYRIFIRSVFAHNTISVDNQTYDFREESFIGDPVIDNFHIGSGYSFVKASHSIFDGVDITRTIIFFSQGAIYIHDSITSNDLHSYSQIFNIGQDVVLDVNNSRNISLTSSIDESQINLKQLNNIDGFTSYYGSLEPMRGWKSTTFNQIEPISSLSYYLDGSDVEFSTTISIDLDIDGVEHNNGSYKITFSSGEDIVVDTDE